MTTIMERLQWIKENSEMMAPIKGADIFSENGNGCAKETWLSHLNLRGCKGKCYSISPDWMRLNRLKKIIGRSYPNGGLAKEYSDNLCEYVGIGLPDH